MFAKLENFVVTDLHDDDAEGLVPVPDGIEIGSAFIDGFIWVPESAAAAVAAHLGRQSAGSVTMRQARLALLAADLLDDVDNVIATAGRAAEIEWEFAATVERDSPIVQSLAAALDLDDAALDALFADAAGR